jgi:hypothetical protein
MSPLLTDAEELQAARKAHVAGLLHQLELTGRAAGAPLVPTTAAKFGIGNVARAASRAYNTRVRMHADYVAARCAELLAVCGESLEPPPTVPPTPVPPGGVSQRRQMQRLRQALLGQEPAKVRLVAWVDREIRLWYVLQCLTGPVYTTDHAIAQLKRMKDDPLETENQRDIAQKFLAFFDAMHLYRERYTYEFSHKFYSYEEEQMDALVRKLDWELDQSYPEKPR